MEQILLLVTTISVVVNAFVEFVKVTFDMHEGHRFLPLAAIFTGIIVAGLAIFVDAPLHIRIWAGALAGLSATGLFENVKQSKGGGN